MSVKELQEIKNDWNTIVFMLMKYMIAVFVTVKDEGWNTTEKKIDKSQKEKIHKNTRHVLVEQTKLKWIEGKK